VPAGVLVMLPVPSPVLVTVRVRSCWTGAVTARMVVMVPVPVQAPIQPVKVLQVAAVAVSVTLGPARAPRSSRSRG
jgi:hypothetical protein